MNWLNFLSWTLGLYLAYYLVMILYDLSRNRSAGTVKGHQELTFTEEISPVSVNHAPETISPGAVEARAGSPAVISSGGVSLKELFGLCRKEAVVYTQTVSF